MSMASFVSVLRLICGKSWRGMRTFESVIYIGVVLHLLTYIYIEVNVRYLKRRYV